jgi:hypothetical protein
MPQATQTGRLTRLAIITAFSMSRPDIDSCWSAIQHERIMEAVEERVCDQPVLKLLRVMLRARVMEDGQQVRRTAGRDPQTGDQPRHVQRQVAPAQPGRSLRRRKERSVKPSA